MSIVKVLYQLSSEARKRIAALTGAIPNAEQTVAVDLATLTAEQRQTVLDASGEWRNIESVVLAGSSTKFLFWDSILEAPALVALVAELNAARDAKKRAQDAKRTEDLVKIVAVKLAEIEKAIADHTTYRNDYSYLYGDEKTEAARLGIDLAALDEAWERWSELIPEFQAEHDVERKQAKRDAEAAKILKAAQVEAEKLARLAWAKEHGSERLRRVLEGGYEAGRLYLVERCALDYPSCVLDYEKSAETKERVPPELDELDTADALKTAHPDASVKVVWMICEPRDRKAREDDWEDEFEPCAAIEIDDPTYDRYIYKLL